MVGILVFADNHFIVRGPLPTRESALALARHWSLIQIGSTTPSALAKWEIVSREFRENLEWGVINHKGREMVARSPADANVTYGFINMIVWHLSNHRSPSLSFSLRAGADRDRRGSEIRMWMFVL